MKVFCAILFLAAISGVASGPATANTLPPQVTVAVDGIPYTITFETFSYSSSPNRFNTTEMPWWGDQSLAGAFAAKAMGGQLGYFFARAFIGPYFAWQDNGAGFLSVWSYGSAPRLPSQLSDCPSGCANLLTPYPYAYVIPGRPAGIVTAFEAWATNPYSTTFDGGTLLVNAPGSYPTDYNIGPAGGTIDLAGTSSTFSGVFSGSGPLNFINRGAGGGTNFDGANTYTGSTTIGNGAVVLVNGSIGSSSGLTVQSGGTVGGNGVLPATTVNAGGTISPGTSIGTLTAASLNLNGGTINAEIQGPQADRIDVTGAVGQFTGQANLIAYGGGGPWPGFTYTLVSAPNSPAFSTAIPLTLQSWGVPSALLRQGTTLLQETDGNHGTFDVRWQPRNGIGAATSAMQALGQTGVNQLATAGAFDRVFQSIAIGAAGNANNTGLPIGLSGFTTGQAAASGVSAGVLSAASSLLSLPSEAQLVAAINSLSPEPYAAFQSVGLETMRRQREMLMAQAGSCRTTGWVVSTPVTGSGRKTKSPLCVFALAGDASSSIRGIAGLSSYDSGIYSGYYGIEGQPAPRWTVGAAYGYGTSRLSNMSLSSASVSAGVHSASLYGVYQPSERWNIRGLLGYAFFNGNGNRNVAFLGNGSNIGASPQANGYTAAINADYRITLRSATAKTPVYLKPLVGLAWGGYQQLDFVETGVGPLRLQVQSHMANSLVGTVGLELATAPISLNSSNSTTITPRLAVAYQVDMLAKDNGARSLTSSFAESPAAGVLTTQGENRGVNTFLVEGGVDLKVARDASLYANVGYQAFSNGSQFTYSGGIKVSF